MFPYSMLIASTDSNTLYITQKIIFIEKSNNDFIVLFNFFIYYFITLEYSIII